MLLKARQSRGGLKSSVAQVTRDQIVQEEIRIVFKVHEMTNLSGAAQNWHHLREGCRLTKASEV